MLAGKLDQLANRFVIIQEMNGPTLVVVECASRVDSKHMIDRGEYVLGRVRFSTSALGMRVCLAHDLSHPQPATCHQGETCVPPMPAPVGVTASQGARFVTNSRTATE